MPITDAPFDLEKELEAWVHLHVSNFFGDCILLPGFRITTASGKHGVPDGFVFNFFTRSWWIVECELLSHGVWPHIAEQLTRFVVAGRNSATLRQVRDRLFEAVIAQGRATDVAKQLRTDAVRLFQKIELFVESVQPSLALFIVETNKDLTDFCDSLDVPTEIYRVKKFVVNGSLEYYSPDRSSPILITQPDDEANTGSIVFDAIEQLGGGELVINERLKLFRLSDGRLVKVQYSKLHEKHQMFWYGINPSSFEAAQSAGCTDFIFVMADEGFVTVPIALLKDYLRTAHVTRYADESIKHYHIHISPPPDVVLKGYASAPDIDVSDTFSACN